jgi:hypothetical protein
MSRGTAMSIKRPAAALLGDQLELRAPDDLVWGARAAHHDVRPLELGRQLVEAHRPAAEALGKADRAVVAAVCDEHGVDAAGSQCLRGQLAVLTRADHEHAPAGQVAEHVGRELDGHRGHRHPRAIDPGLRAHALAGGERRAEQPVADRAGGPLDERQLVGALHLPLDLGLADDHRVEPRRHREEVPRRLAPAQGVEGAEQLGGAQLGLAREDREGGALRLHGIRRHQVELRTVAGGERHPLVDGLQAHELREHARRAPLGQREPLAQGQRGGLVRGAQGQQLACHGARSSTSSFRASSSRSMRAIFAPMIATYTTISVKNTA